MSYTIKYKCGKKVVFESLRYVDLRCTNLRGADLYGANLRGAKGIISFTATAHLSFAYMYNSEKYIKIGCITHKVSKWLTDVSKIGKKHGYTEHQIHLYASFIKFIDSIPKI